MIGLHAGPVAGAVPASIYYKFKGTVSWQGRQCPLSSACMKNTYWGWHNFNWVGDGWDAAAWAAAGWPTSGEALLELSVHSVA